jgi:hypothetical protein
MAGAELPCIITPAPSDEAVFSSMTLHVILGDPPLQYIPLLLPFLTVNPQMSAVVSTPVLQMMAVPV